MIEDLRWNRRIDWYALDPEDRASVQRWWMAIRLPELVHVGAIGRDGCLVG
jgi:hypothetical protein